MSLLHRLGFHSLERCGGLHDWERVGERWVPRPLGSARILPPLEGPVVEPDVDDEELGRRARQAEVETERWEATQFIAAVPPPGRHRPVGERIVPPGGAGHTSRLPVDE